MLNMLPKSLWRCFLGCALMLLQPALLVAQSGPGIPAITYTQAQLFTVVGTIGSGSHGRVMMLDGYLGTLQTGGGLRLYDISNPAMPLLHSYSGGMGLSEPHTWAVTSAFGGRHVVLVRGSGLGGTGFGIWDYGNSAQPQLLSNYTVPGVPGGYATGLFWLFTQGNVIYCPVGSLGLIIVDASQPAAPVVAAQIPKSALGGFNTVLAYAIGNTLLLANSDGGSGFALLDISDPFAPVLIHSDPNTSIPYSAQVNGGKLFVAAVSNCISCTGGNNGSFHVYDISTTAFTPSLTAGLPSRGGSVTLQDKFAHVAASSTYLKLALGENSVTVAGQTTNPTSGGDIDWVTPIGNLVALGDDQGGATKLVPHEHFPDRIGPQVTMVVPAPNATQQALTSRVGVTMSDMIAFDSLSTTTFAVRPVGGGALAGAFSHQMGVVNFSPDAPLLANTTYEVVIPAGGVRDWAGNATVRAFTSLFATGNAINSIQVTASPVLPVTTGQTASFNVASVAGPGTLLYSWSFGDGSPATAFSSNTAASHNYSNPGHYSAQVTVSNGTATASAAIVQTVHRVTTATAPSNSSTIVIAQQTGYVCCVNADNDTVTAVNPVSHQVVFEVPAGDHPRTLAAAPDGTLWVVSQGDATVRILHGTTGALLATLPLPLGSAPYGIAISPDGMAAYVTLRASGQLVQFDPATRQQVATLAIGAEPKGIAVASDSQRILVTRFLSAPAVAGSNAPAEVYQVTASPFALTGSIALAIDPGPDTENSGRGVPNYLNSITISPDGVRAWAPSKKDNVMRGSFRDGQPLNFESTVRTIVSQIDLGVSVEVLAGRIDFNDREMAFATCFSALGDYAFTALQGSNAIDVRDAYTGDLIASVDDTGRAPQGLVLSSDGSTLYVHNFMSRTMAIYDVAGITQSTSFAFVPLADVATVANEQLAPDVLLGKQIFYNAADDRMNEDGYLSCASCHLDGEHDGRVWDFTDRGEGLRNTATLLGRSGMGHGRLHWTANFDEVQDFESDMRNGFGGDGFLSQAQWQAGTTSEPLGDEKAGLSPELDALASYVASLTKFGVSPHRQANGNLTAAADRGRTLFGALNCASCHSGPGFTDSMFAVRHNVGTFGLGSGQATGGALTGLDTPTLRGLWSTAPYLHDGSAETLLDVLTTKNQLGLHGASNTLPAADLADLVAYLQSIDDDDTACRLPGTDEDIELQSGVAGQVNAFCLEDVFAGETVRHQLQSPLGTFDGAVAAIVYRLHSPSQPIGVTLPGLQVDQADGIAVTAPLLTSGFLVDTPIPIGVAGWVLRAQAIVLSPLAQNGIYATSAAHDAFLR
jgi:cytochrome c peroxidase/streptogramin lyase